jgi:hypothetical protein
MQLDPNKTKFIFSGARTSNASAEYGTTSIDRPTIDRPTIDRPTIDRPTIDQLP